MQLSLHQLLLLLLEEHFPRQLVDEHRDAIHAQLGHHHHSLEGEKLYYRQMHEEKLHLWLALEELVPHIVDHYRWQVHELGMAHVFLAN